MPRGLGLPLPFSRRRGSTFLLSVRMISSSILELQRSEWPDTLKKPAPRCAQLPSSLYSSRRLMKGALTTSLPSPDHKAVVRQEFTQQAQPYAARPLIANPDRLAALVQPVHPQPGTRVLDVAAGPGYVAAASAKSRCERLGLG